MDYYGFENDNKEYLNNELKKIKKNFITVGIIVLIILLTANFTIIKTIKSNIENSITADVVESVTDSAEEAVTSKLTDTVLEQYAREFKYDDSAVPVGVYVAAKNLYTVLDITCTGTYVANAYQMMNGSINEIRESISSTASGIVINEYGYVLTNAHVVTHDDYSYSVYGRQLARTTYTATYDTITATFYGDNESMFYLEIIDFNTDLDLAVLKFKDNIPDQAKYVTFGDSDLLSLGEEAVVIGNAYDLGISVTTGSITNLNADLSTYDVNYNKNEVIQTDAAINSGNSGGPLFDATGECVGIASFKIATSSTEGLNFAICSNLAIKYINSVNKDIVLHTSLTGDKIAELIG